MLGLTAVLLVACGGATPTPDTRVYPSPPPDNGLAATVKASPNKIVVGATTPWGGTDSYGGLLGNGGAAIAGEDFNHAGGVSFGGTNHYVVVKVHDDSSQPDGVAASTTMLVNEEDALGFVGPYAVEGLAPNLRLLNDLKTPELLMFTSGSLLDKTSQNPYLFYVRPLNKYWAATLAAYLVSSAMLKPGLKFALVGQQTEEGQSGAAQVKSAVQAKAGVTPNLEVSLPDFDVKHESEHNQYAGQVQRLVAAAPSLIIDWSNPAEATELLYELHQAGWKGQFVTNALDDYFITKLGAVAEGVVGPVTWTPTATDVASQKFVAEYGAYFHQIPDDHAAAVFDGTRMLVEAYKQVGPDKVKIQDWLAHLQNWQGLQGIYTAQADGELITGVKMVQVKAGKLQLVSSQPLASR